MSIFEYCKPTGNEPARNALTTLRETLERLDSEFEQTPRIADLKRILAERIAEIESESV